MRKIFSDNDDAADSKGFVSRHAERSFAQLDWKRWRVAVAGVLAVALSVSISSRPSEAVIQHASLVPTNAATGFPIIRPTPTYFTVNGNCPNGCTLPREVMAVDQLGRYVVSGGNFYEVELQDGTVLQQKYFAAWNIDTKQIVCANKFTFDDEVLSVAAGPTATTVYVGGRFSKVTGANGVAKSRARIALLNLADCSVDKTFISLGANDKITAIVRNSDRLYIGGDFTSIGGLAIETIAELSATTGMVNPGFSFPTTGEQVGRVKALALNPDASRLILAGRFGTMTRGAQSVVNPTAVIDISVPASPTLTAHSSTGYVPGVFDLQAASVSPTGDSIALAYGTATVSDYVYLAPTTESAVRYRWVHYMRDSSFGIAVSNNAVYVTGHFCKLDPGPGTSDVMAPQMGLDTCTGTSFTGGVWRSHIAALSLTDGTPLAWNPGENSTNGGKALTVTARGLLSGFDGDRVNGVRTGAVAFLDFGSQVEDVTPPSDVSFITPQPDGTVNQPAFISGSAADNLAVTSYRLGVRNTADNSWLQPDGTFSVTYYEFYIRAAVDGTFSTQLALPAGVYSAVARAVDAAGLRSANDATVRFTETGNEGELPGSSLVLPPAPLRTEADLTISGVATDNVAVSTVTVEVRDSTGAYVQDDGTISTVVNDLPIAITAGALGTVSASWATSAGTRLPTGDYTIRLTVTDPAGNTRVVTTIASLSATSPVVTWTTPALRVLNDERFVVAATVTDNVKVATTKLRVTNAAGLFLQTNGTFATSPKDLPAVITGVGTAAVTVGYDSGLLLAAGAYKATIIATDDVKNTTTANRNVTVANTQQFITKAITSHSGFRVRKQSYVTGYTFRVAQARTVSALGMFDVNGNGINDNPDAVSAGLWRQSDRLLLGQASIRKNVAVDAGWFYANMATPVTLQPGVTYVVGVQSLSVGEGFADLGTVAWDPGVSVTGYAYLSGVTFGYPTTQGTNSVCCGFPNLRFVEERSTSPVVALTAPADKVVFGQATTVAATAADNSQVVSATVVIANAISETMQDDGTFALAANDMPAGITGLGTPNASLTADLGVLPAGTYTATVTAFDLGGNATVGTKVFSVAPVATVTPAVTAYSGFTNSTGLARTVGYTFQVSQAQTVSAIGIFDRDRDGLNDNTLATPAAIWRQSDQTVLGQVSIPANAPASSGWFYGDLATPITLQPNTTYVVGYQAFAVGEGFAYNGTPTWDSTMQFRGYATTTSTSFVYPATQGTGTIGYGLPNLKFIVKTPPVVLPIANRADLTGTPVAFPARGADPDGGAVTYRADLLPAGVVIDATTGRITGTPTAAGQTTVTVTVTDDEGLTASTTFSWTTSIPLVPPVIAKPADRTDRVGDTVLLPLAASDPDGGTVSFAASALPAGLTLDAATGVIAGSPTAAGPVPVTITVTDDEGATVQATFVWTITPALTAPVVTAPADRTDQTGTPVVVQLVASDPDGGAVTFSASPLPSGLVIDGATGRITGTPSAVEVVAVTVTVTDDEGATAQASFIWTTVAPPPPCVVTPQTPGVLVDWLPVAGVTSYTVRVNGAFLATVNNADVYAHATGTQANAYVVRYRLAGVNIDIACING